jgi:hypothetical protein
MPLCLSPICRECGEFFDGIWCYKCDAAQDLEWM